MSRKPPTGPIALAFWLGWWASQESACKRYFRLPYDTEKQAFKKHLPLINSIEGQNT